MRDSKWAQEAVEGGMGEVVTEVMIVVLLFVILQLICLGVILKNDPGKPVEIPLQSACAPEGHEQNRRQR